MAPCVASKNHVTVYMCVCPVSHAATKQARGYQTAQYVAAPTRNPLAAKSASANAAAAAAIAASTYASQTYGQPVVAQSAAVVVAAAAQTIPSASAAVVAGTVTNARKKLMAALIGLH